MKTASAKNKGRRLQQWVVSKLIEILGFTKGEAISRPMGSSGEDIIMPPYPSRGFPYSIECKNQERVNIWEAYKQAEYNSGKFEPIVVIKKNNKKPLILVDAEFFISLNKKE